MFFDFLTPKGRTTHTEYISSIIESSAKTSMDRIGFLEREILRFKNSQAYRGICTAERYYNGHHDIVHKKRTTIDGDGNKIELRHLPNNKIVDNQYGKAVAQKVNYLVGKPLSLTSEDSEYLKKVKKHINRKFFRVLNSLVLDSVNTGVGYLHPYLNEHEELCWKHFRTWEILPFWKNEEHTDIESFGRLYTVEGYEGTEPVTYERFDYYSPSGVEHYVLEGNVLVEDVERPNEPYFAIVTNEIDRQDIFPLAWQKVPLIAFKRSSVETPLLDRCKSLQDAINEIESTFLDNMQEDYRSSILVLKNYDGENLAEFRKNLATVGAVKVRTVDGQAGDVTTLKMEVNSNNYMTILGMLKEALIENCRAYTVRDNRLTSDANTMHIQSMFADADMDADFQEVEYQASFEDVKFFIDTYLNLKGEGDYFDSDLTVTFNRNMLINEATTIQNLVMSENLLSRETLLAKHPYCENPMIEKEKLKKEIQEQDGEYGYGSLGAPVVSSNVEPRGEVQ